MRERPILFSAPSVRAILNGTKSMTRRVVKPQPDDDGRVEVNNGIAYIMGNTGGQCTRFPCPYGQPGDRLYVKENTWIWCKKQRNGLTPTGKPKYSYVPVGQHAVYKLDHPAKPEWRIDDNPEHDWRMKVARFMPKWAARLWLERGETRVERLQEITEEDAIKEGVHDKLDGDKYYPIGYQFKQLWDSINAQKYPWESNAWVWVISFRRLP